MQLRSNQLEFEQKQLFQKGRDALETLRYNPDRTASIPDALRDVFASQSPLTIAPLMTDLLKDPDFSPDDKVLATGLLAEYLNEPGNVRPMPNLLTPLIKSLVDMCKGVPAEVKPIAAGEIGECIKAIITHRTYVSFPNGHEVFLQKDIDLIQKELEEDNIPAALLDLALSNGADPSDFVTMVEFRKGYHKCQSLIEAYDVESIPPLLYKTLHIYEDFIKGKKQYTDLDPLSLRTIAELLLV